METEKKKRLVIARDWVWEGENRQNPDNNITTIVTLQWWIQVIIHLSKSMKCKTARVNSKVNHGFWMIMIMIGECRSLDCNKCTTLV